MDAYRLLPVPLLYPCYLVRNQPRSRLYWLVVEGFTTGEEKAPGKRKERAIVCRHLHYVAKWHYQHP